MGCANSRLPWLLLRARLRVGLTILLVSSVTGVNSKTNGILGLAVRFRGAGTDNKLRAGLEGTPPGWPRMRSTRRRRTSLANIGPNLFHQNLTVEWLRSIPRSKSRCPTFRSDNGNRMYISTTRRITSGDELKYRNGLSDLAL